MAKFGGFSIGSAISKASSSMTSKINNAVNVDSIMSGNMDVGDIESKMSAKGLIGDTAIGSKLIGAQDAVMKSDLGQAVMGAKDKVMNSPIMQTAMAKKAELTDKIMNTPQVAKITAAGETAMNNIMTEMTGIDMAAVKAGDVSNIQMPNVEANTPDIGAKISGFGDKITDAASNIDILGKVGK